MELQTEGLVLQELSLADVNDVHHLHSLPEEVDEFNTLGVPQSIQVTEMLLKDWLVQKRVTPRASYTFSIKLIETNQFIGLIALRLGKVDFMIGEVWYKLHPRYWKLGYPMRR